MKRFHLLPLLLLTANFSGTPAPRPQLPVPVAVSVPEKVAPGEDEDENEIIPWRPERRLGWDDFLCAPQKQSDAVASTSTSLGISYQVKDGELTYHISCHFSKKKSWGLLKTDYILAHEQVHFDITEIHARKLYQALAAYQFNPDTFKKDIAAIYEQIVKEKEEMQEAYDGETDHSRRKNVQYAWFDKVDDMLVQTAGYAAYP